MQACGSNALPFFLLRRSMQQTSLYLSSAPPQTKLYYHWMSRLDQVNQPPCRPSHFLGTHSLALTILAMESLCWLVTT